MIKKGQPITIKAIGNGVMIEAHRDTPGGCYTNNDILAFQDKEKFVNWIMDQFIFDQEYDREEKLFDRGE